MSLQTFVDALKSTDGRAIVARIRSHALAPQSAVGPPRITRQRIAVICQSGRPSKWRAAVEAVARQLGFILAVLVLTVGALAQTTTPPPPLVPAGVAFVLEWTYPEDAVANQITFAAVVDGQIVKTWAGGELTQPSPNVWRGAAPGVPFGDHTIVLRASNPLGAADSSPLAFRAGSVPVPPSQPTIIVTVTGRDATIELRQVPARSGRGRGGK